jgi:hypothetical protein
MGCLREKCARSTRGRASDLREEAVKNACNTPGVMALPAAMIGGLPAAARMRHDAGDVASRVESSDRLTTGASSSQQNIPKAREDEIYLVRFTDAPTMLSRRREKLCGRFQAPLLAQTRLEVSRHSAEFFRFVGRRRRLRFRWVEFCCRC